MKIADCARGTPYSGHTVEYSETDGFSWGVGGVLSLPEIEWLERTSSLNWVNPEMRAWFHSYLEWGRTHGAAQLAECERARSRREAVALAEKDMAELSFGELKVIEASHPDSVLKRRAAQALEQKREALAEGAQQPCDRSTFDSGTLSSAGTSRLSIDLPSAPTWSRDNLDFEWAEIKRERLQDADNYARSKEDGWFYED